MRVKILLLDIDGVVKNKGVLIPGIAETLKRVVQKGVGVKFVTNCSLHKIHHFDEKVVPGLKLEIVDPIEVLKSLAAKGSSLIKEHAMIIGTREIKHRIEELGIQNYHGEDVDSVYVFEKLNYDQDELMRASRSVVNGARLYCAGLDRYFWHQNDIYPGVGTITEQLKRSANADVFVLGKPSNLIFELALGPISRIGDAIFVGDDFQIDILGAKNVGLRTVYLTNDLSTSINLIKPYADIIDVDFMSFAKRIL